MRVLQRQTTGPGRARAARHGRARRRRRSAPPSTRCAPAGIRHAIVDAIADRDLEAIGEAAADLPLITGGSGIALGLPENFRRQGLLGDGGGADALPRGRGRGGGAVRVVLARRRSAQVAYMRGTRAGIHDRPARGGRGHATSPAQALDWATPLLGERPVLISATAPPDEVAAVQQASRPRARRSAGRGDHGAGRVAASSNAACGGSSWPAARPSGAVVQALGVTGLRIGRQIDPGVPWTVSLGDADRWRWRSSPAISAPPDFFLRAFDVL